MSKDNIDVPGSILSDKVQTAVGLNGQTANVENMMSLAEQMAMNAKFIGNEGSLGDVNLGLQVRPEISSPSGESVAFSKEKTGGLISPVTPAGNADLIVDEQIRNV